MQHQVWLTAIVLDANCIQTKETLLSSRWEQHLTDITSQSSYLGGRALLSGNEETSGCKKQDSLVDVDTVVTLSQLSRQKRYSEDCMHLSECHTLRLKPADDSLVTEAQSRYMAHVMLLLSCWWRQHQHQCCHIRCN